MNSGLDIFRRKITGIFKSANQHVSQALESMPNIHEVGLDFVLLTHLQSLTRKPIVAKGGWACTVNVGFSGSQWHFQKKEIGDILLSLRYYKQQKFSYGKLIFLQSKRLRAAQDKAFKTPFKYKWDFKTNSRYKELDLRSSFNGKCTQYERIRIYEKMSGVRVFYLLYNPWQVPVSVVIPGQPTSTRLKDGARIIAARDIWKHLGHKTPSTYTRLMTVPNTSLEKFMGDLVLCQHGRRIGDEKGFKELHDSILGGSGAIWEVSLEVQIPADTEFPTSEIDD